MIYAPSKPCAHRWCTYAAAEGETYCDICAHYEPPGELANTGMACPCGIVVWLRSGGTQGQNPGHVVDSLREMLLEARTECEVWKARALNEGRLDVDWQTLVRERDAARSECADLRQALVLINRFPHEFVVKL